MKKIWFISGASSGLGKELAKQVLAAGYLAAIGARKTEDVADITSAYPETAFALKLDVTKPDEIVAAVAAAKKKFGRIDVLVNNAGIGYFGSLEESDEAEVRRMFEINFFGLVRLTREVLPLLRSQHSGHILNISSILGLVSAPAVGFYSATKFAVDGYSESLSKEVGPLGIKVTIVAPSNIRTDWAGRSAKDAPSTIEDYKATAGATTTRLRGISGKQKGDPARMSAAIIKIVESQNPPLRLLLGNDSFNAANAKLVSAKADYDAWAETSVTADFPQ